QTYYSFVLLHCDTTASLFFFFFFFLAEDGIRDRNVTGVQTCALPISCDLSNKRANSLRLSTEVQMMVRREAVMRQASWQLRIYRSEERRVGKECRSRWWKCQYKKKKETEMRR